MKNWWCRGGRDGAKRKEKGRHKFNLRVLVLERRVSQPVVTPAASPASASSLLSDWMSLPFMATAISSNSQWNPQGFPRAVPPSSVWYKGVAPKILSSE